MKDEEPTSEHEKRRVYCLYNHLISSRLLKQSHF